MTVYERVTGATNALFDQSGAAFTAGFLTSQLVAAVEQLPKTRQKQFLAGLDRMVGDLVKVKVKNLLSGQEVEIAWNERGTCTDPSTERYHSM